MIKAATIMKGINPIRLKLVSMTSSFPQCPIDFSFYDIHILKS
ncbi:hypothetical protein B4089_2828 [Bacillus licheniformis]|nr:hypothetical protein B4089_2828 [Bacillus licheniformis]